MIKHKNEENPYQDLNDSLDSFYSKRNMSISMVDSVIHFTPSENDGKTLLISGCLGGSSSLVGSILSWFKFAMVGGSYLLIVSLSLTLCSILFFLSALFGWQVYLKEKKQDEEEERQFRKRSKWITILGFFLSVVCCVFLAVSGLVLVYYKFIHFNYLMAAEYTGENENSKNEGANFPGAWTTDRRILITISVLLFFSAFCYGINSFSYWNISKSNSINVERILFSVSGLFAMIFGVLAARFAKISTERESLHSSMEDIFNESEMSRLFWFLFIYTILLMIAHFVNFFKNKLGFFSIGLILLVFCFFFSLKVSYNLRFLRLKISPGNDITVSCISGADKLHEDEFYSDCKKYLSDKNTCPYQLDLQEWEKESKVRQVNPICARNMRVMMLWPVLISSIYSMVSFLFTFIMVYCSFYFWSNPQSLNLEESLSFEMEDDYRRRGNSPPGSKLVDRVETACLIVAFLWFFFGSFYYFTYHNLSPRKEKPQPIEKRMSKNSFFGFGASEAPIDNPQDYEGFQKLPEDKYLEFVGGEEKCKPYRSDMMVSLGSPSSCPFYKCTYRLFILAESMEIFESNVKVEGKNSIRTTIFPGAKNSMDGYIFIWGRLDELSSRLQTLKFCPLVFNRLLSLFFYVEQVDYYSLAKDGLKDTERSDQPILSDSSTHGFPEDFQSAAGIVCKNNYPCKYSNFIEPSVGKSRVNLEFRAKSANGDYALIDSRISQDLKIEIFHNGSLYSSLKPGSFGSGTEYSTVLEVPTPSTYMYVALVKIEDTRQNRYLRSELQVEVTMDPSLEVMKTVYLILPNGGGCLGDSDFEACVGASQERGKARVSFETIDALTNELVGGITLNLMAGFSIERKPIFSDFTKYDGKLEAGEYQYGLYSVASDFRKYRREITDIIIDGQKSVYQIFLIPKTESQMDIRLAVHKEVRQVSLRLDFESRQGKKCYLSELNKECSYSSFKGTAPHDRKGTDLVSIQSLTDSVYALSLEILPLASSSSACQCNSIANYSPFNSTQKATSPRSTEQESDEMSLKVVYREKGSLDKLINLTEYGLFLDKEGVNRRSLVLICFTNKGVKSIKKLYEFVDDSITPLEKCSSLYTDTDVYAA